MSGHDWRVMRRYAIVGSVYPDGHTMVSLCECSRCRVQRVLSADGGHAPAPACKTGGNIEGEAA